MHIFSETPFQATDRQRIHQQTMTGMKFDLLSFQLVEMFYTSTRLPIWSCKFTKLIMSWPFVKTAGHFLQQDTLAHCHWTKPGYKRLSSSEGIFSTNQTDGQTDQHGDCSNLPPPPPHNQLSYGGYKKSVHLNFPLAWESIFPDSRSIFLA